MTEHDYIIIQRLTLLRVARDAVSEAVVHLNEIEPQQTRLRSALTKIVVQIEDDERLVKIR